jgi:fibronectin-binding autotransporter adhesin
VTCYSWRPNYRVEGPRLRKSSIRILLACFAAFLATSAYAAKSWTGAVSNLWSVGGNWSGGIPPVAGDDLVFPNGAANQTMVNDLPAGLALNSLAFTSGPYSLSGNGIGLSAGLSTGTLTISAPITLNANQTFTTADANFAGPIDLNGKTLTVNASGITAISGSLIGSGALIVSADPGSFDLTGTSSFTGTITLQGSLSNMYVGGTVTNATFIGNSGTRLRADGTLAATSLVGGALIVGNKSFNTIGIVSTGNLSFQSGFLNLDIINPTPGTGHDQIRVTGTVSLTGPTLAVSLPSTLPTAGQTFVIIDNDGTDPVVGTFSTLPEGATLTVGPVSFRISYVGGTGNDITLTVLSTAKSWTGAVSNLWSVGGNWSGGIPPVAGDDLVFPNGAANQTMVNDLPAGLGLNSLAFTSTSGPYSLSGNGIGLGAGLSMFCCTTDTISAPIILNANQTFTTAEANFAGPIDLNGKTLTITASSITTLSGSLIGSGALIVSADPGSFDLTGTSSFTGTITLQGSLSNMYVGGSVTNATFTGNSGTRLRADGTLAATSLVGAALSVGNRFPNTIGIVSTGNLSLQSGFLNLDLITPTPGTGHDQIRVTGTVSLTGPTLAVSLPSTLPTAGQTFVIIDNDGTDPVVGTFSTLPEGATLTVGPVSFRISYVGGTGNDVVLTTLASTATALTSSKNPTVTGELFTLTAHVTSGSGVPTGSVVFTDGAVALGTAPLDGSGNAALPVGLHAGSHTITATYPGAGLFAPSSASIAQTVDKGTAALSLNASPSPSIDNQSVAITIHATAVAPAVGIPSGSITLRVDGQAVATAPLDATGNATATLSPIASGLHTITADYGGSSEFLAASAQITQQVMPRISIHDTTIAEGATDTIVHVTVTLSGPSNQTITVAYASADVTATAGSDYIAVTGNLQFAPGITSQTIDITIKADSTPEHPEVFHVSLSSPTNAAIDRGQATIMITDPAMIPTVSELVLLLLGGTLALIGVSRFGRGG